jgi:hypothetical protein
MRMATKVCSNPGRADLRDTPRLIFLQPFQTIGAVCVAEAAGGIRIFVEPFFGTEFIFGRSLGESTTLGAGPPGCCSENIGKSYEPIGDARRGFIVRRILRHDWAERRER